MAINSGIYTFKLTRDTGEHSLCHRLWTVNLTVCAITYVIAQSTDCVVCLIA